MASILFYVKYQCPHDIFGCSSLIRITLVILLVSAIWFSVRSVDSYKSLVLVERSLVIRRRLCGSWSRFTLRRAQVRLVVHIRRARETHYRPKRRQLGRLAASIGSTERDTGHCTHQVTFSHMTHKKGRALICAPRCSLCKKTCLVRKVARKVRCKFE